MVENAEGRPNEEEEADVFQKKQSQHDALISELMSAQHHLCDAEKSLQNSRKLTEEELANLPNTVTEDEFGRELARKLARTTRNYIDAQQRVVDAQAERRRLRVPAVDRYPLTKLGTSKTGLTMATWTRSSSIRWKGPSRKWRNGSHRLLCLGSPVASKETQNAEDSAKARSAPARR